METEALQHQAHARDAPSLLHVRRPPGLPSREEIPESEHADYDFMLTRIRGATEGNIATVAGEPYAKRYFEAMTRSPCMAASISRTGTTSMNVPGSPGTLTAADHEMIDAVLCLDSGYTFLLAGHAALAIQAGVRIEALEALRDGREESLTADERQQVRFIRAVRDGQVTDDLWAEIVSRLGSERGAVEYAFFVCLVLFHHLFASALGVPDMTKDELASLFRNLRRDDAALASYSDYARLYGTAPFDVQRVSTPHPDDGRGAVRPEATEGR